MTRDRLKGVGLALSGGGATGAGTMLGFAAALDLFLLSHDVTDLESYSGVSAGAILAAYFAAGISPHDLVRAHAGPPPHACVPFRQSDLYVNWGEIAGTPFRVLRAAGRALRRGNGTNGAAADLGVLPSGLVRNDRLAEVLRRNLEGRGANDFRKLGARLSLTFCDLLRNERVVCGNAPGQCDEIPVHEAVIASAAIPGVFTPRRLRWGDRTMLCVDGGSTGASMNLRDVAFDGLDVLIAYSDVDYPALEEIGHASLVAISGLVLRMALNQGTTSDVAAFVDAHPRTHVVLFETPPGSGSSLRLSVAAGIAAARRAFDATRRKLAEDADYLAFALEGRGVRLNPEIASVRFEDVRLRGRAVKEDLRRRHGIG